MTQKTEKNQTLNMTFGQNEIIKLSCKVRAHNDVPKNESVTVYFNVLLTGKKVNEVLDVDLKVRFQSTLRNSFDSQNDLIEFAEKYGNKDNPYNIHFDDLSKKIRTPEQKKAELIRAIKAQGYSVDDIEKMLNE